MSKVKNNSPVFFFFFWVQFWKLQFTESILSVTSPSPVGTGVLLLLPVTQEENPYVLQDLFPSVPQQRDSGPQGQLRRCGGGRGIPPCGSVAITSWIVMKLSIHCPLMVDTLIGWWSSLGRTILHHPAGLGRPLYALPLQIMYKIIIYIFSP